MEPGHKRLIAAFIAALMIAHGVAIAARIDQWPLSNYAMFAQRKESTVTWLVLMGVTECGEEFRLDDPSYWHPYSSAKLAHCLRDAKRQDSRRQETQRPAIQRQGATLSSAGQPKPPVLPAAVKSLLEHYESRRQAGLHAGPPLAGLRLYECQWHLDPRLANVNRPDRQELIYEFP
ncbi:MAG TPA: hypothetical protein VFV87_01110, partial [Pirellulaceae bacterium]|nr:hypothetical protein [Pirellulaceae bacterium]